MVPVKTSETLNQCFNLSFKRDEKVIKPTFRVRIDFKVNRKVSEIKLAS